MSAALQIDMFAAPAMDRTVVTGDCRDTMRTLASDSVDSIVSDPPYGISFMGKGWDHDVPGVDFWTEALRVAKPGAFLLAFGGTRKAHRLAVAIEDAGWEIRDSIAWMYGSGFPKSLDVSKAIDAAAGAVREVVGRYQPPNGKPWNLANDVSEPGYSRGYDLRSASLNITAPATDAARQWSGWGTALKPAHEPVIVARKPLAGTVAHNVAMHGTGAINVDGCRIETIDGLNGGTYSGGKRNPTPGDTRSATAAGRYGEDGRLDPSAFVQPSGRWPANVILDEEAGAMLDEQTRSQTSRFFYCAKASKSERNAAGPNAHPTVKPIALMRYLVRLVTPPGGLVLDPFCGSGSTGVATVGEGFRFLGCELDETHAEVARARIAHEESMR